MSIVLICSMTVKQLATTTADIAVVLQSLSDPVRIEIVRQLAAGEDGAELTCGELELPVGKSTCSHHLKVLVNAGVVAEREEGTRKYLRLRRAELERRFPGLVELVLGDAGR
jgi:DNA-binding transcriptional ArsR family regulator